ncbi:hypothetical protein P8452_07673 [Trifolium repens]|nr:hypothetical protein P8452_07673 [Trifolium repens]
MNSAVKLKLRRPSFSFFHSPQHLAANLSAEISDRFKALPGDVMLCYFLRIPLRSRRGVLEIRGRKRSWADAFLWPSKALFFFNKVVKALRLYYMLN